MCDLNVIASRRIAACLILIASETNAGKRKLKSCHRSIIQEKLIYKELRFFSSEYIFHVAAMALPQDEGRYQWAFCVPHQYATNNTRSIGHPCSLIWALSLFRLLSHSSDLTSITQSYKFILVCLTSSHWNTPRPGWEGKQHTFPCVCMFAFCLVCVCVTSVNNISQQSPVFNSLHHRMRFTTSSLI